MKEWLNKEDEDISEIRKALIRYSLINIVDENSFRVHRLVQEVIRLQMSEQEDLQKKITNKPKYLKEEHLKKLLVFI